MLSRLFLVLAGLFAGMWLRDGSTTLYGLGVPWLALLALLFAVAASPRAADNGATARLEDSYRRWLDAWQRLRTSPDRERAAAEVELSSAANMILVTANDRVVKSLKAATDQDLGTQAVAQLVLDMRRSLRRAGVKLRAADLEAFLAPARRMTIGTHSKTPGAANPASFLS